MTIFQCGAGQELGTLQNFETKIWGKMKKLLVHFLFSTFLIQISSTRKPDLRYRSVTKHDYQNGVLHYTINIYACILCQMKLTKPHKLNQPLLKLLVIPKIVLCSGAFQRHADCYFFIKHNKMCVGSSVFWFAIRNGLIIMEK